MGTWTASQVKADLPSVAISIAEQPRETCPVVSRGDYCLVAGYAFGWQSVADAINFNRALVV